MRVQNILTTSVFLAVAALCRFAGASGQTDSVVHLRIMPLGDSFTEAFNGQASYRCWLWELLTDSGYEVDFVGSRSGVIDTSDFDCNQVPSGCPFPDFDEDHESHYGWETDDLINGRVGFMGYPASLPQSLSASLPGYVLLLTGLNDIIRDPGVVLDSIMPDYGEVIDTIRAYVPSAAILVAQLPPVSPVWSGLFPHAPPLIPGFNSLLADLADSMTTVLSPVVAVDMHTGFDEVNDLCQYYSGAGVAWVAGHPVESGERKIAQRWFTVLDSLVRTQESTPVARNALRYQGHQWLRFRVHGATCRIRASTGPFRVEMLTTNGRRVAQFCSDEPGAHVITGLGSFGAYVVRATAEGRAPVCRRFVAGSR